MTNSFLSNNSFQPQASPVDTYVRPSKVAPTTGFDQLVNALVAVNPSLNSLVDYKIKENIREEQAEGIKIAEQEALTGFKKVVNNVRKKDGDELANQLIGGSIFADNAYQKQKAFLLGSNTYEDLFGLYQGKTFEVEIPDGKGGVTTTTKPIHHFDVTSPQFTSLINDFSVIGENKLIGIKPEYQGSYYTAKAIAIEKITKHHITANSQYKIERQKGFLGSTLFSNWTEYEKGTTESKALALKNIQDYVETTVNLGLSDAVTADNILNVAKNQASSIFEINQRNGGDGYLAAMKYFEMIENIKYGPKELQKNGTFKQRTIGETMGEDILRFKADLAKREETLSDRTNSIIKENEEKDIIKIITENPNNFSVAEELLKKYPHRREFLFDQIEIYDGDRDELFNDFNYKVGIGFWGNNRVAMFSALDNIKASIGATWTEEDEKRYQLSAKIARQFTPKNVGNFDRRIGDMHRDIRSLLGATGDQFTAWKKDDQGKQRQYINLKTYINNRIMDEITLVPDLKPADREKLFREIQAEYFQQAELINSGGYKSKDVFLTQEQKIQKAEEDERKAGIQAIMEDFGMSEEDATLIYDEDVVETVFDSATTEEETTTETTTEETPNKEKSWIELLIDGLKGKNNNELVSQLNDAKQNSDESETSVIDSILNALMAPTTAADLKDKLTSYTVESGDTVSGLADQFSTTVKEIMDANNLTDADFLQIGQKLMMPMNTIEEEDNQTVKPKNILSTKELTTLRKAIAPYIKDNSQIPRNYLTDLYRNAGFEGEDLKIMVAIALAESRGRPNAFNKGSKEKPEESYGISQINMYEYSDLPLGSDRRPKLGIDKNEALYDPVINALAARLVFNEFKASKGDGFLAWSVYSSNGETKDENPLYLPFYK